MKLGYEFVFRVFLFFILRLVVLIKKVLELVYIERIRFRYIYFFFMFVYGRV